MLKRLARAMLRSVGLEVRRIPAQRSFASDPFQSQKRMLAGLGVTQPTIFDVGAHWGETVTRYRAVFPESRLYCFEPYPPSVEGLTAKYGHTAGVTIVPAAVADSPGERVFYVSSSDSTNSLLPRPIGAHRYYLRRPAPVSTIRVPATTIDEFARERGLEHLHVLKFDIQGGELMALRGASRVLRDMSIPLIFTEAAFVPHYEGAPLLHEIWAYLAGFGYTLFDLYGVSWADNGQLRQADALFVSPEVRERVIDRLPGEP